MEINNIPDIFSSKLRLAAIAALIEGPKTFSELKDITKSTDGNLGAQLSKLEGNGVLVVEKTFVNRKPQTTYGLTDEGRAIFREYVDLLDSIIKGNK
ncbi:MAG: transcriptional regulator [Lachnospiraceae bacterium]|nr:transcriptional regulator [Lachnospiraceae bacterium]